MGRHRTCESRAAGPFLAAAPLAAACVVALVVWVASVAPAHAGQPAAEPMINLGDQTGISISRLIDMIAKDLEVNFLLPDQLTGTVTMKWKRPLPKSEALEILRTVLDDEGYVLVETPHFMIIRKQEQSRPAPTDVVVVQPDEPLAASEKLITAIIVLKHIEADEASKIVAPLQDRASSHTSVLPRINALIIKDAESRVRYLMEIIEKLDVPGTAGIVTIVRIDYADARELVAMLKQVIASQGPSPIARGGEVTPAPGGAPAPPGGLVAQEAGITILADLRLNSIVIVASQRETEQVLELIKKLDVPPPPGVFPIHTFQCKNQKAVTLAGVLRDFSSQRPPLVAAAAGAAAPAGRTGGGGGAEAEVFFIADEATNKILVSASALDWDVYRDLLEELDQPQPQVLVEVWIVEVSSNDQFSLGVEWQTRAPSGDLRVGPSRQEVFGGTSLGTGLGDVFAGNGLSRGMNVAVRSMTNTRITIGGKTYIIPDIDAYLRALSEVSHVNVLSSPKLLTLNNEDANVDVTDKIPYSTSTITGVGADRESVEQWQTQDVGISLKFTPQINADGYVIMNVTLDVSSVVGADVTEAGPRPVIAERKTQNKVRVEDGHTIIISGLRRHDRTKTSVHVPVLGRIPLVGLLFQSSAVIDKQTNLMIFITPHIVTDTPAMEAVSEQIQSQDVERERPRFEIDPKRWRKDQRERQREKVETDEKSVWQQ
jgi:general secretion pathway protein D